MSSIKIRVPAAGYPTIADPATPRGYAGRDPIVEVTGTDGVPTAKIISAYKRAIVLPIMHAEMPVPWAAIVDVRQGQFVRIA